MYFEDNKGKYYTIQQLIANGLAFPDMVIININNLVGYSLAEKVIRELVNGGADVNALDDGDETALCRACRKGNVTVVQKLIEHGAEINSNECVLTRMYD